MTTQTPTLEIRPLTIPDSIDSPDAADFVEMTRVRNLVYREISGHDDDRISAAELLPFYSPAPTEIRLAWVAVLGGEIVGRVGLDLPLEKGSRVGFWRIELLRRAWGHGLGSAAYAVVENAAREHGRTVLQSTAEHPSAEGPRLHAPTGFGSIPEDRGARFYLRNGYSLEQVDRMSALDLSAAASTVDRLLADAIAASSGYRVVQWMLPTPPEFAAGYAWMKSRMNTDAPAAGLEFDEEVWDRERLERHDAMYVDAGRTVLLTAAQHIDSGELVAFNELVIGNDRTEATHQEDTLVLRAHRGHRLGMLVKCAALVSWRDIAPDSLRAITFNAEENRPMLDINEAIGFTPISYEGSWKKVLA